MNFISSKLMGRGWMAGHSPDNLKGAFEVLDLPRDRFELIFAALDSIGVGNDALEDFQAK